MGRLAEVLEAHQVLAGELVVCHLLTIPQIPTEARAQAVLASLRDMGYEVRPLETAETPAGRTWRVVGSLSTVERVLL